MTFLNNFHCMSFSKAFLPLEKLIMFYHLFRLLKIQYGFLIFNLKLNFIDFQ
jgi:hypothetical protein